MLGSESLTNLTLNVDIYTSDTFKVLYAVDSKLLGNITLLYDIDNKCMVSLPIATL